MKTRMLLVLFLSLSTLVNAQYLRENESALVYHMPYTWVELTIDYQEVTCTVGPFYQYAGRYLGTKDVVTDATTTYAITEARFSTFATADTERFCTLQVGEKGQQAYCSLTEDGRLLGVNVTSSLTTHRELSVATPEADKPHKVKAQGILPLLEEQMIASTTSKMAEGAARLIYRIRETRLNILAGDVDHVPADGEAMQQVLKELRKQENELTALFVGTRTVTKHQTKYIIDPAKVDLTSVLFRFSQHTGPVASDDLSGEPYTLTIKKSVPHHVPGYVADPDPKKKGITVYYNTPGNATLTLTSKGNVIATEQCSVAQWGVLSPLHLTYMPDAQIHFCPTTGVILSIEK